MPLHTASASDARNILFLLSTLAIGGSERKIVRLANALCGKGLGIVLAYLNRPDTLLGDVDPSIEVVHLDRRGKFSLPALRGLRRAIRDNAVDTVVSVNLYATLYCALLALRARELAVARFVASLNTTDLKSAGAHRSMILYRPMLRKMDLLIFGAEYQRALWLEKQFAGRAPRSGVLYNGVDAEYFSPDGAIVPWRPPGWPASRVVIGTVGVLRPEKSHDHLLAATANLTRRGCDVGLMLVGGGPRESALRCLIADLGLTDRAHLPGEMRDVRPYLAAFDIFVLTSTTGETFSNAALEALAMHCPVVSSEIGGMPEMLASGGGLLYRPGDVEALTETLAGLVASEQRRRTLAEQARRAVVERFSLESMVENFRALLADDSIPRLPGPQYERRAAQSEAEPLHGAPR